MGFCDRVRIGAFLRGGCGQDGTERPVLCGFTAVCYRLCRRGLESGGQIGKDIRELRDTTVRFFFASWVSVLVACAAGQSRPSSSPKFDSPVIFPPGRARDWTSFTQVSADQEATSPAPWPPVPRPRRHW